MGLFFKKVSIFFTACRGYSIPTSFMSWIVPFLYAATSQSNRFFGLIALLGILSLHLGTNIFDDAIDYTIAKRKIEKGEQKDFNFQSGKCIYIFNGDLSLKHYYIIAFILFLIALVVAVFFFSIYGFELLKILVPSAILCLMYPILGSLGLGEILVAIIFSPLIYMGVYFVMTGLYSTEVLILSISTGFLVVSVLHNHMLMDYKIDEQSRKMTLCRLCKTPQNALILLAIFITLAYINLLFWIATGKLHICYLLPFITIPIGVKLIKIMKEYTFSKNHEIFLSNFLLVEKLLSSFTLLLCISIVVDKCIL